MVKRYLSVYAKKALTVAAAKVNAYQFHPDASVELNEIWGFIARNNEERLTGP
jgi:hypothetical protein